jgi:predicted dehydrogenase
VDFVKPERPMRIAVVGAGLIGGEHLAAYERIQGVAEVAAICDLNPASARRAADLIGIDEVYTDPFAMLEQAEIDAVDICTIHDQHAPIAVAAASTGRHVLVEKPMACTMSECLEMVRVAEENSVTLMVAQNLRYLSTTDAAREIIQRGEIGEVRSVQMSLTQCWPGVLPGGHWLFDGKKAGGGVVISCAIHPLDLIRDLVGNITSISADCRKSHPEFVNGAEDVAAATMRFDNGALGTLFASTSAASAALAQEFYIYGDAGTLHGTIPNDYADAPLRLATGKAADAARTSDDLPGIPPFVPVGPPEKFIESFPREILHFVECCEGHKTPRSDGRDNLETMRVVLGIYEASATGNAIDPRTL